MRTETFKVGDEIHWNGSRNYIAVCFFRKSTVAKVTKTGQVVTADGYKFNARGEEMKSKSNPYPVGFLIEAEQVEKETAALEARNKKKGVLKNLMVAIDSKKSGDGNIHLSAEAVEMMEDLTALING